MIVIRYKGGLGNQMFQYAMQAALKKNYPDRQILADTSHYLLQPLRKIVATNLQYQFKEQKLKNCKRIQESYYRQISHCSYEQEFFCLEAAKDYYLDGLWQNIAYFSGVKEDVFVCADRLDIIGGIVYWAFRMNGTF